MTLPPTTHIDKIGGGEVLAYRPKVTITCTFISLSRFCPSFVFHSHVHIRSTSSCHCLLLQMALPSKRGGSKIQGSWIEWRLFWFIDASVLRWKASGFAKGYWCHPVQNQTMPMLTLTKLQHTNIISWLVPEYIDTILIEQKYIDASWSEPKYVDSSLVWTKVH